MSAQQEFPFSTLTDIFPPWTSEERHRLREDIAAHGLRQPIAVWRGRIIDGRHRYQACIDAHVTPLYRFLDDAEDPVAFILSENLVRRHLNDTQRAAAAFRLTETPGPCDQERNGGAGENFPLPLTQREAARLLRVSDRSVKHAARVLSPQSQAVPELRQAVAAGTVRVSDGSKIVNHTGEVQRQAVAMVLDGKARTAAAAAGRISGQLAQAQRTAAPEALVPGVSPQGVVLHPSPVANLHTLVPQNTVDAIVTFPPADGSHASLLADLAAFAAHSLRPAGVMLVLADTRALPQVLALLSHDALRWVCAFHYTHPGAPFHGWSEHRMPLTQKLLLVYGKPHFRLDAGPEAIAVPPLPEGRGENRRSPRLGAGMALLIERFTLPHHVVADPVMASRHETAVAAVKLGRPFTGAWPDSNFIDRLRARLAREAPGE